MATPRHQWLWTNSGYVSSIEGWTVIIILKRKIIELDFLLDHLQTYSFTVHAIHYKVGQITG